jgi:hypothetical protein
MMAGLDSGVALAVQLPIAKTFVVSAFAAAISAAPVLDLLSSAMMIKSFTGQLVVGIAS